MSEFILFIRDGDSQDSRLTPEEMQQIIGKYRDWAEALAKQDKLVSAYKLRDDGGRLLRRHNQQIAVDGPLPETKETIGGYFVIKAHDYAEAIELAKGCPTFERGGHIELRQIEL
jgi:hypothetical protein